jgi:hypothetical protein
MARIDESELRHLLHNVRAWAIEVEDALEAILADCGEGVTPTTPPDTGTTLLSAIGRILHRLR